MKNYFIDSIANSKGVKILRNIKLCILMITAAVLMKLGVIERITIAQEYKQ